MGEFEDRVVIVTGGASFVGEAIGAALIEGGAWVILADRDAEHGPAVAERLGPQASFVATDVASDADLDRVIDALEAGPRGWYGGAVGYLGYDGGADFAICIRSLVATDDVLRVQAGSGIVFDSVPDAEDAECHAKASAVLRAIAIAREARAEGELP